MTLVLRRLKLAYDVEPQMNPSMVTVKMRESYASALPTGQPVQLDISPDVERLLRDRPPGQSATVTLQIVLAGERFGPGAKPSPNTIEVTATVQAQRAVADILHHPPLTPTLYWVLACVTLNKPQRDGELLCGLCTVDRRRAEPAVVYGGLGDDPSQYVLAYRAGRLVVRDGAAESPGREGSLTS